MGAPNLEVGRYAVFIWPAYAISGLTLLALVTDSVLRAARWRKAALSARPDDAPGETP